MGQINLSNYFVLILSAGFGKRMGSIGRKIPKALFRKDNKTLLEHIIFQLKNKNISNVNFILGYKSKLIINELNKLNLNFNILHNKNYKSTGSVFSWYLAKKMWEKNKKKKFLILHSDIFFDPKFLNSILSSKQHNIIGIKKFNEKYYKDKNLYVCADNTNIVKDISYGKYLNKKKIKGQILCINKLSRKMTDEFFKYCSNSFKKNKKNKDLTWEVLMNNFIKEENKKFHVLTNQNYYWFNVNTKADLNELKNF